MRVSSSGSFAIYGAIASGGMASVHIGRQLGPSGFSRIVAVKRLLAPYATDGAFRAMFLDEARMAGSVRHPNVVPVLDVLEAGGELLIVMEYVEGATLSVLTRAQRDHAEHTPPAIAVAIVVGMLRGLHAAHEARGLDGHALELVHRDVSPQNVLVGSDGYPRLFDFGIAKAVGRMQVTTQGELKGKLAYMAPEQLRSESVDRRADVWGASVVAWELLTGMRLFRGDSEASTYGDVLHREIVPPSSVAPAVPVEVDRVVLRGLERFPERRFATAAEMADALEAALRPATATELGAWVTRLAGREIAEQADAIVRSAQEEPSKTFVASSGAEPSPGPPPAQRARQWAFAGLAIAAAVGATVLYVQRATESAPKHRERAIVAEVVTLTAPPIAPAASSMNEPLAARNAKREPVTTSRATSSSPAPQRQRAASKAAPASEPAKTRACRTQDKNGIWKIRPECL